MPQKNLKRIGFVNTVDGVRGPNTNRGETLFSSVNNRLGQPLEVLDIKTGKVGICNIKECAEYNSELGAVIAGYDSKRAYQEDFNSVGNAWERFHYMKKTGAYEKDLKDYDSFTVGDSVSLERGRFGANDDAYKAAKDPNNYKSTGNQHIGTIVGKNSKGVPLVAHNFHGKIYVEPINNISKAYKYKATGVISPYRSVVGGAVQDTKNFISGLFD